MPNVDPLEKIHGHVNPDHGGQNDARDPEKFGGDVAVKDAHENGGS